MTKCWFCNKPVIIEQLPPAYEHRRKCMNCGNRITSNGSMYILPKIDDSKPPSYLPVNPDRHAVERVPDLNPDDMQDDPLLAHLIAADERDEALRGSGVKVMPFFPDGAIAAVQHAVFEATERVCISVRAEWVIEYATIRAHVAGIESFELDAIMGAAIPMMPQGIGIDIHVDESP